MKSLLQVSIEQLKLLRTIAESEPQAAHSVFVGRFKEKFIYFMRAIAELAKLLKPLNVLRLKFISSITGGHICPDDERKLPSLPLLHEFAPFEYENSKKLTQHLCPS